MKKICVLLNGHIETDSRVIKEICTLSSISLVDLYCIEGVHNHNINLFNNNVRVFRFKQKKNTIQKIIKHSFFYKEFGFFSKEVLKQKIKYDYIWANDLPTLYPALQIKKQLNSKVIYDSHEIYIETINQFFPDEASFLKKIAFKLIIKIMRGIGELAERNFLKKIDFFVTVNTSLATYFQRKYNLSNIKVVMNCPQKKEVNTSYNFRGEFPITQSDKIVIFQGCLNKGRALIEMIKAMQYVDDNIKMIILGDGMLKSDLQQLTKELHLTNKIFFKGMVSSVDLLTYTKGADIGINLQSDINVSKCLASATKLFEYIHVGLPIVTTDVPESRFILEKFNIGCLVNNTPNQIAEGINQIAAKDKKYFKNSCEKAAQTYNWKKQEKIILEML